MANYKDSITEAMQAINREALSRRAEIDKLEHDKELARVHYQNEFIGKEGYRAAVEASDAKIGEIKKGFAETKTKVLENVTKARNEEFSLKPEEMEGGFSSMLSLVDLTEDEVKGLIRSNKGTSNTRVRALNSYAARKGFNVVDGTEEYLKACEDGLQGFASYCEGFLNGDAAYHDNWGEILVTNTQAMDRLHNDYLNS